MRKKTYSFPLFLLSLVLTSLACVVFVGGPDYSNLPPIPVSAEAAESIKAEIQRAVQAAADTGVLTVNLTDDDNGLLNPIAVNCLRSFPVIGRVVWGSRTMRGADQVADDYKYIPVRRLALYIEESLYRGTQWVVFAPNDEPLWAQIRLNVGAFMQTLFRQGAFKGASPREAYFVKCDDTNNPPGDVDQGRLMVDVGVAPTRPAEFIVFRVGRTVDELELVER